MNYIKQSTAFFELQMTNTISVNAQAIYHILFNMNNKCRWQEKFKVTNKMLMAYTELSEQAIVRARNELINLGIIKYEKGNGGQCGTYSLIRLYGESEEEAEQICRRNVNSDDGGNITLYKQNNTKEDETKLNTEKESVREKEKKPYGEHAHVLLTDDEYSSLGDKYENRDELITFLDEYIEEKGYKSKSHYIAINRWVKEAVAERKSKAPPSGIKKGPLNNFSQEMPDFQKIEAVILEQQRCF